jgi:hypothetical protein
MVALMIRAVRTSEMTAQCSARKTLTFLNWHLLGDLDFYLLQYMYVLHMYVYMYFNSAIFSKD